MPAHIGSTDGEAAGGIDDRWHADRDRRKWSFGALAALRQPLDRSHEGFERTAISIARTNLFIEQPPSQVGQHGVTLGATEIDADDAARERVEGERGAWTTARTLTRLLSNKVSDHEPADGSAHRRCRETQTGCDLRTRRGRVRVDEVEHQLLIELEHQPVTDGA